MYAALVTGTRDYVRKCGFGKVLVALSGGIDSSLVATIATDALGHESVLGVAMPSRYSSEGSLLDAMALAENLGIGLRTISIEDTFAASLDSLAPNFEGTIPEIAEENLQSRIRGLLIMALSNRPGWMVLTTGNKSEMAVGYATIYGYMAGGYAVIKDVPKTLVYRLAEYRNALSDDHVIPESVLTKVPSAELRPDQKDQDSLPPVRGAGPDPQGLRRGRPQLRGGRGDGVRRGGGQEYDLAGGPQRVQAPPGTPGDKDHPEKLRSRPPHAHRQPLLALLTGGHNLRGRRGQTGKVNPMCGLLLDVSLSPRLHRGQKTNRIR